MMHPLVNVFDFPFVLFRGEEAADPEDALAFLATHCRWAVVTLGPNGCIVKHKEEVSEQLVLKHARLYYLLHSLHLGILFLIC